MKCKYDKEDLIFDLYDDNDKYIHSIDISLYDLKQLEKCGY